MYAEFSCFCTRTWQILEFKEKLKLKFVVYEVLAYCSLSFSDNLTTHMPFNMVTY